MQPIVAGLATLALVYRAYTRKSLTPGGICAAILTACAHAYHPWSVFFVLLCVFYMAGTFVTKVKHETKRLITRLSTGHMHAARTHKQVLANSIVASILIILHARSLKRAEENDSASSCFHRQARGRASDVLVAGIVAHYAAVASDTFSSELGILSTRAPRLITVPWRAVPRGTNGGVTATGIHAGLLGAFLLSAVASLMMPYCADWPGQARVNFALCMTGVGLLGSLFDSWLGAVAQATVVEWRRGWVVEGEGGDRINSRLGIQTREQRLRASGDRKEAGWEIVAGRDILSNNGVNLVMAGTMSLGTVLFTSWLWGVPLMEILK